MATPEGAQCYLCGECAPVDQLGFVSRVFDVTDPEFIRLTATLPERFRQATGTARLAVYAHLDGHGCAKED